jgi:hypothetical protein
MGDDGLSLTDRVGGLDSARVAGLLVIGSVILLGALRRGFGDVRISIGD